MTEGFKKKALSLFAAAALLLSGAAVSAAQQQTAGTWTKLGSVPQPLYGVAADPANAQVLFALGAEGISVSADAGANWKVCGRGALNMRLVAPQAGQSGPASLYSMGPGGLRQSTDGCQTWRDVPSNSLAPSASSVRWIAPYPNNPSVLYAGIDGLGGLYRSSDAGATWQAASKGLPAGAWVTALTADPTVPSTILIGIEYANNTHSPAYVFKSTDGGLTWRSSSLGIHVLPHNGGSIVGLAWSGTNLFAATAEDGLFMSTDRGTSWSKALLPGRSGAAGEVSLPGAPQVAPMPLPILSFAASNEGALLIGTPDGAYSSVDGARSWQGFGPSNAEGTQAIAVDASNHVILADSTTVWGMNMPTGVVSLPSPTSAGIAQVVATPPPPPLLPTNTPMPPTATATTQPSPTPTTPARPAGYLPSDKAQPLDPSYSDYFQETGHNIKYGFRDYWRKNDGIHLLGFPITEEFVENGTDVQYFERARLEYHGDQISWGLLGTELTKGRFFQTVRFFPSTDTDVYFGPTQHSSSGPFLAFWRDNGGLATFGYPLSESYNVDGSEYQWFERARLEWHPWLPEGKRIVLGNIGTEYLQKRGWIK